LHNFANWRKDISTMVTPKNPKNRQRYANAVTKKKDFTTKRA